MLRRKWIWLVLLLVFLLIQLIPLKREQADGYTLQVFDSEINPATEILQLLSEACYDCHTDNTAYPWYASVAPVSWWIDKHVRNGRKELNFSDWAEFDQEKKAHLLEESAELVEEKKMPLTPYWIMHPPAKLSEAERKQLADWFRSKRQQYKK